MIMCNATGVIFGATSLTRQEIEGKKIIEIGSYDVNGSLRSIIESSNPAKYIGVDIEKGPGVDVVCDAGDVVKKFGKESFDIVIATELLEHVKDWRKVVSNIKSICKPRGIILITTRSLGFAYHAYPHDFWRYEIGDMNNIFSDYSIKGLETDKSAPGVFMKASKPNNFREKNLSDHQLHSIILNRRVKDINESDIKSFQRKYVKKERIRKLILKVSKFVFSRI
jgi:predicted SAM-dependent methyltransferase